MYTGGLGEILPNTVSYAAQDAPAKGMVELVRSAWDQFKSGAYQGGNFEDFQEVVRLGWVPDTVEGYDRFMWYRVNVSKAAQLGLVEFVGWYFAYDYARLIRNGNYSNWPVQSAAEAAAFAQNLMVQGIRGYVGAGYVTAAQGDAILAAYQRFFTQYAGSVPAPSPVTTAALPIPVPDPAYPIGLQLLIGGGTYSFSAPVFPLVVVLGWRRVTVYTGLLPEGGNTRYGEWKPTPRSWVVRGALPNEDIKRGWWAPRPLGVEPVPWATQAWDAIEGGPPIDRPARFLRDETEMLAWLQSFGLALPIPGAWTAPVADVGSPTPLPQPGSPTLPPGSEVRVPVPGSEGPVLVRRPGETEFTPLPVAPRPVQTWTGGGPSLRQDVISDGFPATETGPGRGSGGGMGWLVLLAAGGVYLMTRKKARAA